MLFKISQTHKIESSNEKVKNAEQYYPIYYALTGFLFGGVLMLSALNDFLFFGWLCVSMSIIFGLLSIHVVGKQQTKKW